MELENKKQNSIVSYFKNLSQKDKIILSSTIVIAAIVLGLRFVIVPQIENYSSNLNTLELKKAEEAKIKVIPRQNEILEEKNEELKKQYDIALEEISKTPAVAKIIYDLKELIISNNIEIKSINFSSSDVAEEDIKSNDDVKTDENGMVTEIERGIDTVKEEEEEKNEVNEEDKVKKQIINMSIAGKYEDIIEFIKAIEGYSRISDVSNISFSQSEGNILIATLTANFYNLSYKESENYDFNNGTYGKENSFN
ncbi:type 4a pilus biogenesis protein PilO [Clostridium sp. Sa3CUN1]|uniref:Type 4a pilus biogenesis protein PilO n=1 Tax=Clostridium gallinarum TaxID=2762246 RepID=A0ABR8Q6U0_9CLOT|nr:type 4a pilus biogenesis protein PilO [Clostridium gallinarum]MBD7915999.1 type 4a pilus biogenesis protein PilO [Clostridium gallinarum]